MTGVKDAGVSRGGGGRVKGVEVTGERSEWEIRT